MRKKNINYYQGALHPQQSIRDTSMFPQREVVSKTISYQSTPPLRQEGSNNTKGLKYPIQSSDQMLLREKHPYDKSSVQMMKLKGTIDDLAKLRIKNENNKKYQQSKENISRQTLSEAASSASLLPSLVSIKSGKDQSKLMSEIRKVQNKIKALKFQRSKINAERSQFEMIRPIIQMHNQNMLNMQMMMLAMQQQNNQQQSCCHHSDRRQQNPYQYMNPFIQNQRGRNSQLQEIEENGSNKYGKKKSKLPKKTYNFDKIRKFRIAVIAVYFYLLLPKYVFKFTKERLKMHSEKYFLSNINEVIQPIQKDFINEMLNLNSIKIARYVKEVRADKKKKEIKKIRTAKIVINEQYNGNKNFEFDLVNVEIFLWQFLKKMQVCIQDGGLQSILRFIGDGNMPYSFPIDNYHILQEMYRITYHPNRMYMKISEQVSKALILSYLIVKLLVFQYFFQVKQNFEWKMKMLKMNNMKKDQMIESQMAALQMNLSGIMLHQHCMEIITDLFQEAQGNLETIDVKNMAIPKQMMVFQDFEEYEQIMSSNKLLTSGSKKAPLMKQSKKGEKFSLQNYQEQKLYKYKYIKHLHLFDQLLQQIDRNSNYQNNIKNAIRSIVDTAYQRILDFRKEEYQKIKTNLLFNKNLLRQKIDYASFSMPNRANDQKKILKQIGQMMKQNKKRAEQGISEDEQEQQGEEQEQQEEEQEEQENSESKD